MLPLLLLKIFRIFKMSFAELIQKKTKNLKKNEEGTLVRTKEGLLFREKIVDGQIVREEVGKKVRKGI